MQDKDLDLFDSMELYNNHICEHLMPMLAPKILVSQTYQVEIHKIYWTPPTNHDLPTLLSLSWASCPFELFLHLANQAYEYFSHLQRVAILQLHHPFPNHFQVDHPLALIDTIFLPSKAVNWARLLQHALLQRVYCSKHGWIQI